ncbi:MAG: tetratricopeptide repeat protein [Acidobacteria bacterium]|nr:tetratricopeptide repeat protein [Acidobacteriota bacterium]
MNASIKRVLKLSFFIFPFPLFLNSPSAIWSQASREPKLIRDTEIAEGKDVHEAEAPKEPNSELAEQNVNIGNYYLKQKNYDAAIKRFLEAIAYQADLVPAYEGLARAYEKNGDILKAINAYRGFINKNPDSPKASDFQKKIEKLEKKTG